MKLTQQKESIVERRILKIAAASAFAIAMGAACNKKDAANAALDTGAHLENCPEMQDGSYVLDGAAAGHAKTITVSKVQDPDPGAGKAMRYKLDFDGIESVTFFDNTKMQDQGKNAENGSLRTGCPAKGDAVITGKAKDPNPNAKELIDVTFTIKNSLGGPDGKTPQLKVGDFTYTKTNALASTAHAAATTGVTTGFPYKADLAQPGAQKSDADKAKDKATDAAQDAKNSGQKQLDKAQQQIDQSKQQEQQKQDQQKQENKNVGKQ